MFNLRINHLIFFEHWKIPWILKIYHKQIWGWIVEWGLLVSYGICVCGPCYWKYENLWFENWGSITFIRIEWDYWTILKQKWFSYQNVQISKFQYKVALGLIHNDVSVPKFVILSHFVLGLTFEPMKCNKFRWNLT